MRINGVKTAIKGHTLFEQSGCTINGDLGDDELFFMSCHSKMLENSLALKYKNKSYLKYISIQLTAAALCVNLYLFHDIISFNLFFNHHVLRINMCVCVCIYFLASYSQTRLISEIYTARSILLTNMKAKINFRKFQITVVRFDSICLNN